MSANQGSNRRYFFQSVTFYPTKDRTSDIPHSERTLYQIHGLIVLTALELFFKKNMNRTILYTEGNMFFLFVI